MLSKKEMDEIGNTALIAQVANTIINDLNKRMGWNVDDIIKLIDETRARNCEKYPFLKGIFNRYDDLIAKNPDDKTKTDLIELETLLLELATWEFRNELNELNDEEAKKKWLAVALIHNFQNILAACKDEVKALRRGE